MTEEREETFLARWSRRKREDDGERRAEDAALAPEAAPEATAPAAADPAEPDAPERHPAEDIDVDTLDKDSDFTVFMEKGVPALVQQAALRKLWTSDPVLACLDGLNDYEDMEFTYGMANTAGATSWKLGRGFQTEEDLERAAREGGYRVAEEEAGEDEAGKDEAGEAEVEEALSEAEGPADADGVEDTGDDAPEILARDGDGAPDGEQPV
ncbi:MAG: DUF3306 domain-containing protein [Flavobacteriaceae bacterium]